MPGASWRSIGVTAAAIAAVLFVAERVPAFDAAQRQMKGLDALAFQDLRERLAARPIHEVGAHVRGSEEGLPLAAPPALPAPGRHAGALQVRLLPPSDVEGEVYFTRDGSIPTRQSERYERPIAIDSTTVLRWRVLARGRLPGEIATGIYLIEPPSGRLPLLGLTLDSMDLWGKYSGIYVRPTERGRAFERPAHVSVVESDGHEVVFEANVRIHGGYSRLNEKKSFRIRFPSSAVAPRVTATDILEALPGPDEHNVVIRATGTNLALRLADGLSNTLFAGLGYPVSRAQPVRVTINGAYWGLYDLREYVDTQFLASRYGNATYEVLAHDSELPGRWLSVVSGTGRDWASFLAFIRSHDLRDAAAYDSAKVMMHPESLIDYWAHGIYTANLDWPYNNAILWRRRAPGEPYRFALWDADATFSSLGDYVTHNTLAWSLRDRPTDSLKWNARLGGPPDDSRFLAATEPMRAFLRNPSFRDAFVTRLLTLLATQYAPRTVGPQLDSLVAQVEGERPFEHQRWGSSDSVYRQAVARMHDFIARRPDIVRRHLAAQFGLGAPRSLVLEVRGPGALRLGGRAWRDTTVTLPMLSGLRVPIHPQPDLGAEPLDDVPPQFTIAAGTTPATLRVRFGRAGTSP